MFDSSDGVPKCAIACVAQAWDDAATRIELLVNHGHVYPKPCARGVSATHASLLVLEHAPG